jgi:hypothetical protein
MKNIFHILFLFIILVGCGSPNKVKELKYDEDDGYETGSYCAEISYHNPNTGTSSTYSLNVEVDNNELVQINWPNGGWLDNDHFSGEDLDASGFCSFTTDRGYEMEVQISGPPCTYTQEDALESDVEADEEALECPKCGGEKEDYNDLCEECQDEKEHTCPRCGNVDGFMFSTDDYCSDCEDEIENTCSNCGSHEYGINGGLCSSCENDE